MEVIPKNLVRTFTDYKTVVASRGGLDYYAVTKCSNTTEQAEWSDVPDDTEWELPGLHNPEFGP